MRCPRWLVVLAACGGGKRDDRADSVAVPAREPPVVAQSVRASAAVTATHGSTIVHVAATEDGRAAVSSDQQGALRLWPALDGTREPIVVRGAEPAALAIARDGDGFAIANHDAAGGVELIRVAADGAVRGRRSLGRDPEIVQVELVSGSALVLRADRAIEVVAFDGSARARLVPDPGTRTHSLIARAGRVLALLEIGTELRGRWIDLEGTRAAWGAMTPTIPLDPARPISLSPDHTHLVGSKVGASPVVVALATGAWDTKPTCTLAETRVDPFVFRGEDAFPSALGFVDKRTIACATNGRLTYWGLDGDTVPTPPYEVMTPGTEFALGDNVVVGGLGHQLGLYTPKAAHYLGYGFRELTNVRAAPTGLLIGKGDHKPILLDPSLRERARFPLPVQAGDWTDLVPLDDRYLLTASTRPMLIGAWGSSYQVSVYDSVLQTIHQLLPNVAGSAELVFEPATQLLASSDGGAHVLLHYDARTHSFDSRTEIATNGIIRRVQLTDPELADGVIALAVRSETGAVIVDELSAADVTGASISARATFRIAGTLRAVDRAGQLYVQRPIDVDSITVYRHGTEIGTLANVASLTLRPSPDGAAVAVFDTRHVALYATSGTRRWDVAAWGATDMLWDPDGALVARFAGALATLDPITGELRARQCGWGFGLAEKPFETSTTAPNVCDVDR